MRLDCFGRLGKSIGRRRNRICSRHRLVMMMAGSLRITRRRIAWLVIIVLAVAAVVTIASTLSLDSRWPKFSTSDEMWRKLSWRVRLYASKATGGVPDYSWNELWQMTQHEGGFGLEDLNSKRIQLGRERHQPICHRRGFKFRRTFISRALRSMPRRRRKWRARAGSQSSGAEAWRQRSYNLPNFERWHHEFLDERRSARF